MESGYAMAEEAQQKIYRDEPQKKKKIGFFKRWMLKAVKEAVEQERQLTPSEANVISARQLKVASVGIGSQYSIDQPERAIHFTVYTANGGRIVETRRVDRKTDRHTNGLYIITNDQEFGREIDKIITMEALK